MGHSISPELHNAAFDAAGIDARYLAFDVDPGSISAAVDGVAALRLLGANVTVPHKRAVFLHVPRRTADAEASGAANTVYWEGGDLAVDNTDVGALRTVLARDCGLSGGEAVLLLGTGGAARAVALAAGSLGVRLEVVGRRPDAVREINAVAGAAGADPQAVTEPALVINATPLGLAGEHLPDRFTDLGPGQTALDLVYGATPTPFLAAAQEAGAAAVNGLGMLVGQAAAAFERWTGRPAPGDVMARAASAALSRKAQPGGATSR